MTPVAAVSAAAAALARVAGAVGAAAVPPGIRMVGHTTSAVQAVAREPLPAKPPIGGPIWTIVVPALLLVVSIWGTWMLYRHFAGEK